MARKPKTAPVSTFATWVEEDSPGLTGALPPARRGRKSTPDASPAEPLAAIGSDDAVASVPNANGSSEGPVTPPVPKRPGPKPKQKPAATVAAPPEKKTKTKPGHKASALAAPKPAPAEDVSAPRLTGGHDAGFVNEAAPAEATPDTAVNASAQLSPDHDTAASAQPAAQWDRAADTVSFDWPAIARTAAQEGPNQGMAKLLLAARAEGANSRWPL